MTGLSALIGQAVARKQLTKAQGSSHLLFMIKLMIEKHMTFADAHKAAMRQVGR